MKLPGHMSNALRIEVWQSYSPVEEELANAPTPLPGTDITR